MSYIEVDPFPYLKPGQYSGLKGNGEIDFIDPDIPEKDKKWLQEEYRKWWEKRENRILETGWI